MHADSYKTLETIYNQYSHLLMLSFSNVQMWACARGHLQTAVTLFSWNKGCLHAFNREGNLPLLVARQHGHHKLADHLEQLDSSGDQSLDLGFSSASHESLHGSRTSIFGTGNLVLDSLDSMSSSGNSVSNVNSTPVKSIFTYTNCPNATSTPISKDTSSMFSELNPTTENSEALGALHIDIPSEDLDLQQKSHEPRKRENPSHRPKTIQSSKSTCSANVAPSSSTSNSETTKERRQKLRKRFSVDIISNQTLEPVHFSPTTAFQRPVREANSEPHLAGNVELLLDCQTNPMLSQGRELGMYSFLDNCSYQICIPYCMEKKKDNKLCSNQAPCRGL